MNLIFLILFQIFLKNKIFYQPIQKYDDVNNFLSVFIQICMNFIVF